MPTSNFQPVRLLNPDCWYKFTYLNKQCRFRSVGFFCCLHHHHHIRFKAGFPLPRVALVDKSFSETSSPLRMVLGISRVHSQLLSVVHQHFIPRFLGLPGLFCATTFSLRTLAVQPVLRSTCPNHLILLVRSTTSKSWMPSFERRESELTSSFALTLQIQRIIARSLCCRRFSEATVMAQVSAACSITLLTHDEYTRPLVRSGRLQLVRRGSSWRNLPQAHCSQLTTTTSREHVS